MKRLYARPELKVSRIDIHHHVLGGSRVHTDDPQPPGNALTNSRKGMSDEDNSDDGWADGLW